MAGPMGIPTQERPHVFTHEYLPVVMGHEVCGTIKSSNAGSKWKAGQKVMIDPRLNCKSCTPCKTNHDHQCSKFGFLGFSGQGGGFSEVIPVEESMLYAIPDHVPLEYAALVEPLTVAHHAVKASGIKDFHGKTVLIVGGGPVGYAMILSLRSFGVKKIIVSEPTETRRKQTGKIVESVIDPKSESVGDKCREMTAGNGVDVAFDCAGVQKGLDAALDALAHNGTWVNVSIWETPMTPPFWPFMMKELTLRTSFCYNDEDFREVMELIAQGKMSP